MQIVIYLNESTESLSDLALVTHVNFLQMGRLARSTPETQPASSVGGSVYARRID